MMRLGFVVKPLGRPNLKPFDSRRWQNKPHLSVSLAYLRDVFAYSGEAGLTMYRMATDLAPYATHPTLAGFNRQVEESEAELAEAGSLARRHNLRLSFHVHQAASLNSPDTMVAAQTAAQITLLASILDGMELGPEAVIVTHLGGVYGDPATARERFVSAVDALPGAARARLTLENDDVRFGMPDVLWAQARTGLRLVFDKLHYRLRDRGDAADEREALAMCLATWPPGVTPKIHWSTPRTELRVEEEAEGTKIKVSRWTYHSDLVNPFEFIDFMRGAAHLRPFDVMLEVRGKDLAVLQLRRDLGLYAPDLAQRELSR
jgi:UV DNA damage endonuclease